MSSWREFARYALEDAETVRRFGQGTEEERAKAAQQILSSARYVLQNFTEPPSVEPPRQYPSKFITLAS